MNSSTLPPASAQATWKRAAPRFCPSRRICWTSRKRMSPAPAPAGMGVLGGHRRHQAMEARLAGELGVEGGGEDVLLADGHDPPVVEAGEDVDARAGTLYDRGPDEDRVDRPVTEHRD